VVDFFQGRLAASAKWGGGEEGKIGPPVKSTGEEILFEVETSAQK